MATDEPRSIRELLRAFGDEFRAAVRQGLAEGIEQARRERAARSAAATADEPVDLTRVLRRSRTSKDLQA